MANVTYTALRTIASGHTANTEYSLDFEPSKLDRSRMMDIKRKQSIDGTIETLRYSGLVYWDITANELDTTNLGYFREFLDSVEAGETFVFDAYGTDASPDNPINCKLDSHRYRESRIGTVHLYRITFKVRVL